LKAAAGTPKVQSARILCNHCVPLRRQRQQQARIAMAAAATADGGAFFFCVFALRVLCILSKLACTATQRSHHSSF
jgi:hypothetical protein